ncbi:DMT family transporter [Aquabacter sp. CN5-332]|uniref:DMT family transporter n=1 Tax=Aquabacter sp. CN5-332 TaxID=3156608 RepID=UPI0032B5B125
MGFVALVAAIAIWGANWPVMKLGLEHITPLWFSSLRFASGALSLLAWQAMRGEIRLPRRGDGPFIASVGLLQMMAFTALGAAAMTHLPAGRSAMLSYVTPLWVVPASLLFFGERVSGRMVAGVAICAAGVAILLNPATIDWTSGRAVGANAMLLVASLCWALCILHLRYFRSPSSAFELAPWQMLLAAGLLAMGANYTEGPFTGDGSMSFWAILLFVGPLATAFCFCAVNAASTWLPAGTMSTAMLGVPVTGVAISVALFGEPLTIGLAAGSLAILAGIAVAALAGSSRSIPKAGRQPSSLPLTRG